MLHNYITLHGAIKHNYTKFIHYKHLLYFSYIFLCRILHRQGKILFPSLNLLKPTGHVMRQQFNIQHLYVLPTLYLCVLYLSENKERLVPLTA